MMPEKGLQQDVLYLQIGRFPNAEFEILAQEMKQIRFKGEMDFALCLFHSQPSEWKRKLKS